jgi:hypothetical protein
VSANRSSAVMQQKRAGDSTRGRFVAPSQLNYFPTPPWATRALGEFLNKPRLPIADWACWEPACGEGHMVRPLAEYFGEVIASDVHRYGDDHLLFDFTLAALLREREDPDFVITNPPFTLAAEFIAVASSIARRGFAMFVRSAFLEGGARYRELWAKNPPSFVLQFSERVVLLEGRLIQAGAVDPFAQEEGRKATTATSYVWLVWLEGEPDTRMRWIPPCRARLEREGDYPDYGLVATDGGGLFGEVSLSAAHAGQPQAAA